MNHTFFLFINVIKNGEFALKVKVFFFCILFLLFLNPLHSSSRKVLSSYHADYSLMPDNELSEKYKRELKNAFVSNYSYQAVMSIPRSEIKGYSADEILQKLDQMGGIDKECYGVSYIDANNGKRKPVFKKAYLYNDGRNLLIKDKTAGVINFDFSQEKYGSLSSAKCIVCKNPDNILLREIKKNEAGIFVLIDEKEDKIQLYVLIQCSYSPKKYKFLTKIVEKAIAARVMELENWFYRMLCQTK